MKEYILQKEDETYLYVREKKCSSREREYHVREVDGLEDKVRCSEEVKDPFEELGAHMAACAIPALAADYIGWVGEQGIDYPTFAGMAAIGCLTGGFKKYKEGFSLALATSIVGPMGEALWKIMNKEDPSHINLNNYLIPSAMMFAGTFLLSRGIRYVADKFNKPKKKKNPIRNLEEDF